jgi:hypothetical protein
MTIGDSLALLSAVAMKGQKCAQIVFGDPHDTARPMRNKVAAIDPASNCAVRNL